VLEKRGLVFFVRDSALTVIMPKGRHALTGEKEPQHRKKKSPLDYIGQAVTRVR
jgi:hypothetical protein